MALPCPIRTTGARGLGQTVFRIKGVGPPADAGEVAVGIIRQAIAVDGRVLVEAVDAVGILLGRGRGPLHLPRQALGRHLIGGGGALKSFSVKKPRNEPIHTTGLCGINLNLVMNLESYF